MILVITRCPGVVSRGTNIKRVAIPSRGTTLCRVRAYTDGRLYFIKCIYRIVSEFNFSFKPIQRNSDAKIGYKYFPINSRSINKGDNKKYQKTDDKEMTPNKLGSLNDLIKSFLHFIYGYGFNLHIYSPSYFCIIPLKYLKSTLENKEFFNFLSYSCKKSNTSGLKVK